jgi:hypothetical protein
VLYQLSYPGRNFSPAFKQAEFYPNGMRLSSWSCPVLTH